MQISWFYVYLLGSLFVETIEGIPKPHREQLKDDSSKDFLKQMIQDWFDVKAHPMVHLTEKQQHWFHSLGYSKEFRKAGSSPKRTTPRQTSLQHERTSHSWEPPCVRKDLRALSEEETLRWHNALYAMKDTWVDDMSEYDIMVTYHMFIQSPAAHGGASFLPWHREYLLRMERALQAHEPDVCLPYWDSTTDSFLPLYSDAAIWTDGYFGKTINGTVDSGPFGNWSVPNHCQQNGEYLARDVGGFEDGRPYRDEDLQFYFSRTRFEELVCNVDCRFEDDHGRVHAFVLGHMGSIPCAPSDPVFWTHHCFIDYMWEEFRRDHQETDPELDYPVHGEDTDIGGPRYNPLAEMKPFEYLFNIHGLSNHYTNYYYTYGPRLRDCEVNADCVSEILWCDVTEGRCKAKVKEGGSCMGFPDHSCVCFSEGDSPACSSGICTC